MFIYRSIGETDYINDVVDGIDIRYKWMLKLVMAKLLNPESIFYHPNFTSSFMFSNLNKDKL